MAKYLKDILKAAHDTIKGVRPSETSTLSTGKDPGVDYKPKSGDEADFIAKHSVQKWDDVAGNPNFADKVSHALASPKEKNHGNTLPQAKAANEEVEQIDELSTDLLHRAAHKAAKRAMGDAQGRSGPIFKKYAGMANKFRDKGMSQEKKEKAAKAVKEETDPGFSESKKAEDVLCNSTSQGTECPVHGIAECMSARPLKEISTKLALSYAKGASKSMDTAAAKGSAGHETFMKRSAGHKLALDKTNPEHKRLKAKVGTTDANAKDAAYKKSIGEEIVDEAMTVKQKQFSNRVKTMPGKKGAVMGATSNFEAPFHKVHATISKNGGAKETVKHEIKAKDKHDAIFDVQMMHHKAGHKVHDVKHKGMVKEDLAVPLLGGDQKDDESAEMAKAELKAIVNQALTLVKQIPDTMIIEPWVQSKIAQAKVMVNSVHDYMVYGNHDKEEEDEGTMDTPITLPNMSVDVNTGRNV